MSTSASKLLVANWKSNHSIASCKEWFDNFKMIKKRCEVVIAPPFTLLDTVRNEIDCHKLPCKIAVQNFSKFGYGASTGEVCAENLRGLDVKYVILGHSERRTKMRETNDIVASKITLALEANITPIVCLDEDYIDSQAKLMGDATYSKCVYAYEPLSAISTTPGAKDPHVKKVIETVIKIKKTFGNVRVIYGGSVTEKNIIKYIQVCDGILVGGASLNGTQFSAVVAAAG